VSDGNGELGWQDYTSDTRTLYFSTFVPDPVLMLFSRHAITQGCWCVKQWAAPDSCGSSERGESSWYLWSENSAM